MPVSPNVSYLRQRNLGPAIAKFPSSGVYRHLTQLLLYSRASISADICTFVLCFRDLAHILDIYLKSTTVFLRC